MKFPSLTLVPTHPAVGQLFRACKEGLSANAVKAVKQIEQGRGGLNGELDYLEQAAAFESALHQAALWGQVETCQTLFALGIPLINQALDTTLQVAASVGQLRVCAALIDLGADVNTRHPSGTSVLLTALIRAAPIAELLLQAGADATMADAVGQTPLHGACAHRINHLIAPLAAAGAALDAVNQQGQTPLHLCAQADNAPGILMLYRLGAQLEIIDAQCFSPLGMALDESNSEAMLSLIAVGAQTHSRSRMPSRNMYSSLLHMSRLSASIAIGQADLIERALKADRHPESLHARVQKACDTSEQEGRVQGPSIARALLAARTARDALAELQGGLPGSTLDHKTPRA